MSNAIMAAVAVNRFGIGARPGEVARVESAPRAWLAAQVASLDAFMIPSGSLPTMADASNALQTFLVNRREQREATSENKDPAAMATRPLKELNQIAVAEIEARTAHALSTDNGYAERLVTFWSNHFTVAATKALTIPFVGLFERQIIRAGLTGRFEDLLLAAVRHPCMLLYLDQAQSVGPDSAGAQSGKRGLNENLAREVLELHTIGPQAGYSQADVTEFARALTGWTIAGPRTARFAPGATQGEFLFLPPIHEPGSRTVLGRTYPDTGEGQARAILSDLARHPATAQRIATKLVRHFTRDDPPPAAVARLERAFVQSGGALPALHTALIDLPDAWEPQLHKFKTPQDFFISALRLVGISSVPQQGLFGGYQLLGQPPFRAPSPKGWPDDAASWAGPDAIMKRLEWSQALAERVEGSVRPEDLVSGALGPLLSAKTRQAVQRAETAKQGLTLALMSPEFQRR